VISAAKFALGTLSVNLTAVAHPTHSEMVYAPYVIAAVRRCRLKRAAELGFRESGDVLCHSQFLGRVVERRQSRTKLRIQDIVRLQLLPVSIESSQTTEEDLAP